MRSPRSGALLTSDHPTAGSQVGRRVSHAAAFQGFSASSGSSADKSAENNVVPLSSNADRFPAAPTRAETAFGLPMDAFRRAWTARDVQDYLCISRTQTYELLRDPSAPPRLPTGRSHRWNGLQLLAWLHHQEWDATDLHPASHRADAHRPRETPLPRIGEHPHGPDARRLVAVTAQLPALPAPRPSSSENATRVIVIDPAKEQQTRNRSWAQQLTEPAPRTKRPARNPAASTPPPVTPPNAPPDA